MWHFRNIPKNNCLHISNSSSSKVLTANIRSLAFGLYAGYHRANWLLKLTCVLYWAYIPTWLCIRGSLLLFFRVFIFIFYFVFFWFSLFAFLLSRSLFLMNCGLCLLVERLAHMSRLTTHCFQAVCAYLFLAPHFHIRSYLLLLRHRRFLLFLL